MSTPAAIGEVSSEARAKLPGMYDVAKVAGVSHQTVSRVLNGHPKVREETRIRVQAAIDQLGYRRNVAARALVTRRSGTIGVVTTRSALYGPTSVLLAIEAAAREAGYFVSLVSLADASEGQMQAAIEHFMDQSVEGVIVIVSAAAKAIDDLPRLNLPVVTISPAAQREDGLYVTSVDHFLGAQMAVRHLIDLGHRRILHLSGPSQSPDATARVHGWRSELSAARLVPSRLIQGDWSAESGYEAARRILDEPLPDAVFAGNDEMALGVLRAFGEAGVRVPEDVSLVGFDDIPGSAFFSPPLTTIRQDFQTLGTRCIELLTAALAGRPPATTHLVPPQLVVRSSSAPNRRSPAPGQVNA